MSVCHPLALIGGLLLAGPLTAADLPARTIPNAHPGAGGEFKFSPDGVLLASAGTGKSPTIKIWDTATGKLVATMAGRLPELERQLVFSPDGKVVATSWASGVPGPVGDRFSPSESEIILWSAVTGEKLHTLKGRLGGLRTPVFSPDGKVLLTRWWWLGPDGGFVGPPQATEAILWSVETGKPIATLPGQPNELGPEFAFIRDGRLLALPYVPLEVAKKTVETLALPAWDPATGRALDPVRLVFPEPTAFGRHHLVPFPDRNWVTVHVLGGRGCTIRFFEINANEGRPVPGGEFPVSEPFLSGLTFSSDGRRAVGWTQYVGVPLVVVDLDPAGRVTRTREPYRGTRAGVSWATRDGRFVLLRPEGVVELDTGRVVAEIESRSFGAALSPDGRWVATRDGRGTIRLWDISRATAPGKK